MTEIQPSAPDYSVVIPVGSRVDDLNILVTEYNAALASNGRSYEIIAVLDGHCEQSLEVLQKLSSSIEHLRVIELTRQFGETSTLAAGFDAARAEKILTLPAYYQIAPAEIPKLLTCGTEDDDMLSNMVREGTITRESALRRSEEYSRPRIASIREYAQMIGLNCEEALSVINSAPKRY